MKTPLGIDIEVGQKWREVDPRLKNPRIVEVVNVGRETVVIKNVSNNRSTEAQIRRFTGKRGGYDIVVGEK